MDKSRKKNQTETESSNLRIVFLCLDDEYAGIMQKAVYEKFPEVVKGVVVSTTYYGRMSFFRTARLILKNSGFRYAWNMAYIRIIKARKSIKKYSPTLLAKKYNTPCLTTGNINSEDTLNKIGQLDPDILLATNFNQIIGKKAIGLPKKGTLNMHKAYLPKHRGMAPSFYALLNGDEYTGITLHWIESGIDTGNILSQKKVPISSSDSVSTLNKRAAIAGGEVLLKFLEEMKGLDNIPTGEPQDDSLADEHSYPTKREIKDFFKKGLRFI